MMIRAHSTTIDFASITYTDHARTEKTLLRSNNTDSINKISGHSLLAAAAALTDHMVQFRHLANARAKFFDTLVASATVPYLRYATCVSEGGIL